MLARVVLAVVVGIVVTLACVFLGGLLATISLSWVAYTGAFLRDWAALFGLLAALWYFFSGTTWPSRRV